MLLIFAVLFQGDSRWLSCVWFDGFYFFCRKKDDLQQAVARQTGSFWCMPFSAGGDVLSEKI